MTDERGRVSDPRRRPSDLSETKHALLKRWLSGRRPESSTSAIAPRTPGTAPILSVPHEGQLRFAAGHGSDAIDNQWCIARLEGALDRGALERAFSDIASRHETLRMRVRHSGGRLVPVVDPDPRMPIRFADLCELGADAEREALRRARAECTAPLDLDRAPPLRVCLFRTDPEAHVLGVTIHHVVFDGWSFGLFIREMGALYRAAATGEPAGLPPLGLQFWDYAHWERRRLEGERGRELASYWSRALEGAPAANGIPYDRQPAEQLRVSGASLPFSMPARLAAELRAFSREANASLFSVLLAGFKVLIARVSANYDVVVRTSTANRPPETNELIGRFANPVALRTRLAPDASFGEVVEHVKHTVNGALAHQDYPFGWVISDLDRACGDRRPFFEVGFILQNFPLSPFAMEGARFVPLEWDLSPVKGDLNVVVWDRQMAEAGGPPPLSGEFQYNGDAFDRESIRSLSESYVELLAALIGTPGRPVSISVSSYTR